MRKFDFVDLSWMNNIEFGNIGADDGTAGSLSYCEFF